ncbi:MAG TPA: DinB family protein [Thermoanaerobaculia bacterium]|nr:DinB family protein [Thermoanaerobaculia bacterium]
MAIGEQFASELRRESKTTRRVLERVPDAHLGWKPHEKSMSLGQLAFHIAVLPRAITELIAEPVTEVPTVPLRQPSSSAAILAAFDASIAFATERLSAWSDEELSATWRMTRDGQTLLEMPRMAMFRSVMLNHWYHHRGQLTVYLRLLDVPLPSVYGPTADEVPF